jgi:hypothetical protein
LPSSLRMILLSGLYIVRGEAWPGARGGRAVRGGARVSRWWEREKAGTSYGGVRFAGEMEVVRVR